MKKALVVLTLCLLSTQMIAQTLNIHRATDEQIPYENRKDYIEQAAMFLSTYYSQLLLNVGELMVQKEFIKSNMSGGDKRYKPEFILQDTNSNDYLTPEQYLQELEKQYRGFQMDKLDITVDNVKINQDEFYLPNLVSCYLIADYDLTFSYENEILFKRMCRAYCFFPKVSVSIIVKLMQIEPGTDIIPYKSDLSGKFEYKDKSFDELSALVAQGDVVAEFTLGWKYIKGLGLRQDKDKGIALLTKAGQKGHVVAQVALGYYYLDSDSEKSFMWTKKAAKQGHEQAQEWLATMYFNGTGILKDDKKAVEWYTKSANQNYEEAQYRLGLCYLFGYGVAKNENMAKEWLAKAAAQGNDYAKKVLNNINANKDVLDSIIFNQDKDISASESSSKSMKTDNIMSMEDETLKAVFHVLDKWTKKRYSLTHGIEVLAVFDGKLKEAGIKKGFIITHANSQEVTGLMMFEQIINEAKESNEKILFLKGVYPSGKKAYFAVDVKP